MYLLDFIAKYPNLLNHPNLNIDLESHIFRHELCHFIEREMDKAYLKNFGFSESLGQPIVSKDNKYFALFLQREVRVMTLERLVPFLPDDNLIVDFSKESRNQIYYRNLSREFFNYREQIEKKYSRLTWWRMFDEKYERLTKPLQLVG